MSWYSKMMKSHEMAREQNRRVARRQESERYGPQFVAKYRIATLDKEKRMIEKELERIRKGIHRPPKLTDAVNTKGNHVLAITSPRPSELKAHHYAIDPEYSKDENKLYDAILFLKNNPSALVPILSAHARSNAYFETLERITPRLSSVSPDKQSIKPKYLTEGVSKSEKDELLTKYEVLLHRHSPELRKNSPLLTKLRSSPVHHKESPLAHDNETNAEASNELSKENGTKDQSHLESVDGEEQNRTTVFKPLPENKRSNSKTPTSSNTPRKSRQPLPIGKLAESGMSSARDNVAQRLTGNGEENQSTNMKQSANDTETEQKTAEEKRTRPKAVAMFPSVDPEVYNADGSLRTCLNMPSFEESWAEAQKARYIRTKETLERDRELSVQEIFDKK